MSGERTDSVPQRLLTSSVELTRCSTLVAPATHWSLLLRFLPPILAALTPSCWPEGVIFSWVRPVMP